MNYILFDDYSWNNLLPLTYTRPVSEIRFGILTIKEKWEKLLNQSCSYITKPYLSAKYSIERGDDNILINSSILPDVELITRISLLQEGQCLVKEKILVALRLDRKKLDTFNWQTFSNYEFTEFDEAIVKLENLWDIFLLNGEQIEADFKLLTRGRRSQMINPSNRVFGAENIFIEEGAQIEAAILNGTKGKIYIGKNSEVMEGAIIRGPFALCDNSTLKLGAKIYGPTTIGPHSKVGGEINNSVILGYTNKAHDGFLGNSVIGEWCNIGADSNNSNLKNNYAEVKLWNYKAERFIKTGLQFCGLIMGDHSKCGINTMFNTGTVIGVSVNIFGAGFPRNFVPSFSWGSTSGYVTYSMPKALDTIKLVMERRNKILDENEKAIFQNIFDNTEKHRR